VAIPHNTEDHRSPVSIKAPVIENLNSKPNPTISPSIAIKNGLK
jgi:hypothetical protein